LLLKLSIKFCWQWVILSMIPHLQLFQSRLHNVDMTPDQQHNLRRLFNPRHAVFVGGRDAEFSARLCAKAGFKGEIWGVNPKRQTMAGFPCFARVSELPAAPDAVFLAVPPHAAIEILDDLRRIGAGGIACFTAGFGELGDAGSTREKALIAAAGDMALVGPNCQGILNYINDAPLWAFDFPSGHFERGAAIVSQSGMLCSNLAMQQRSVPFSYLISAGNQAVLAIEDYLEVLLDDPAVTAIGLYIETLRNISRFGEMAVRALERGKPIVALKGGTSKIGGQLTVTHTGSMSGSERMYSALFKRLGVIQVQSPSLMLETLKLVSVAGAPKGKRIAAFSMSGGDAAMVADAGEKLGLELPQPSKTVAKKLRSMLPDIATVSNPLDLTTPLWGDEEKVPEVIGTLLADGFDAVLFVQDYALPGVGVSNAGNHADARSLMLAAHAAGIPAAVVSSLPENIDRQTREWLIENNVAPLQGIREALQALAGGALHGVRRAELVSDDPRKMPTSNPIAARGELTTLDEWQGKCRLDAAGVTVPMGRVASAGEAQEVAESLGYPVVVKLVNSALPHKTEAGAVKLNIRNGRHLARSIAEINASVTAYSQAIAVDRYLIEQMIEPPVAELLLGVRRDDHFGMVMLIASGGILVELIDDAQIILLPTDRKSVEEALSELNVNKLIAGYRGKPAGDREDLIATILGIADFALAEDNRLEELDINPLMVLANGVVAADVVLRVVE
jgi:acyl-CoA synthetase (NDP forming)